MLVMMFTTLGTGNPDVMCLIILLDLISEYIKYKSIWKFQD